MILDILKALILGGVEGITEFLPISSTGHLIILNQWFSFGEPFTGMFDVVIQLGAILAVIVFFFKKLWPFGGEQVRQEAQLEEPGQMVHAGQKEIFSTWKKVIIGVLPALVVGALLGSFVEEKLFNPWVVACALIIGGIFLLFVGKGGEVRASIDRAGEKKVRAKFNSVAEIPWRVALFIGFIQCLSMIPGTSRAAATIIGALFLGVSRTAAVEFSFFLAIPTMFAASGYALLKHGAHVSGSEFLLLAIGFVTAFLTALAVIRFFIQYIQRHDFRLFGYYRIVLGAVVLLYFFTR